MMPPPKPAGWVARWRWEQEHGIVSCTLIGGNWNQTPDMVRQFDKDGRPHPRSFERKRVIHVHIFTYVGVSVGAKHWYAEVKEVHNRWLRADGFSGWVWAEHFGDAEGRGREFRKSCRSERAAVEAAGTFIRKHFSPKTHEVSDNSYGEPLYNWWKKKVMTYKIVDVKTRKVLDKDAYPTPFMLEWPGLKGPAVCRDGHWFAANYPHFELDEGEKVHDVQIIEFKR